MVAHHPDLVHIRASVTGAEAVYVMGAFNNWSTARTPMVRTGAQQWETWLPAACADGTLRLFVWESGRHFGRIIRLDDVAEPPVTAA